MLVARSRMTCQENTYITDTVSSRICSSRDPPLLVAFSSMVRPAACPHWCKKEDEVIPRPRNRARWRSCWMDCMRSRVMFQDVLNEREGRTRRGELGKATLSVLLSSASIFCYLSFPVRAHLVLPPLECIFRRQCIPRVDRHTRDYILGCLVLDESPLGSHANDNTRCRLPCDCHHVLASSLQLFHLLQGA